MEEDRGRELWRKSMVKVCRLFWVAGRWTSVTKNS